MTDSLKAFVIVISVSTASIIALVIIGAAVVIPFMNLEVPEELKNWGGLIIGFYFGSFIGLLKDLAGIRPGKAGTE